MQLKRRDCRVASLAAVPCVSSLVGRLTLPVAVTHFFFSILTIVGGHLILFFFPFHLLASVRHAIPGESILQGFDSLFVLFSSIQLTSLGLTEAVSSLLFM